ncbi:MAG: protease inhibitor I9 family protein, partial [Dehalococcoidia bacterium]
MPRPLALIVSIVLLLMALPATVLAAPEAGASRQAVIVVFHDSVANPAAAASDLGRRHAFGLSFVYQHALKGFAASVPTGALNALARDPRVAWIEPDQAVHAYEVPTGVERIFADENPEITINGTDDLRVDVDIAIIDTGIDLDHPDLNVVASTNCLNSSGGGPPWSRTYTCGSGGDDDNDHG